MSEVVRATAALVPRPITSVRTSGWPPACDERREVRKEVRRLVGLLASRPGE